VTGTNSFYLSVLASYPFVPGHEVVGRVEEVGSSVRSVRVGDRVVVEPALGCRVRGFVTLCGPCLAGHYANCERIMHGDIAPGIQIGYCRDTGGGWGPHLVAHECQLYPVPEEIPDEAAVLMEPLSCAIHGVLRAELSQRSRVLVVGAGTMGLLIIAALRAFRPGCSIVAIARYPHQKETALSLGAERVVASGLDGYGELVELSGSTVHRVPLGKPAVLGGFDVVFECVGARASLEDAMNWARPQGQVVLVGMPAPMKVDLAPLWYQELRLTGSYAYGMETWEGRRAKTFDLARELLARDGWAQRLAGLVSHRFPLKRHREAIATAMHPGASGAVKTVFDLREG
jgi:threonine dehydrogenase-like Zn-dependent dehydrogenase